MFNLARYPFVIIFFFSYCYRFSKDGRFFMRYRVFNNGRPKVAPGSSESEDFPRNDHSHI